MAITIRVDEDGAPGPQGPPGPPGPPGIPGAASVKWFEGEGPPPDFIPGAEVGSMYVDRLNGRVYQLQTGA